MEKKAARSDPGRAGRAHLQCPLPADRLWQLGMLPGETPGEGAQPCTLSRILEGNELLPALCSGCKKGTSPPESGSPASLPPSLHLQNEMDSSQGA